MYRVCKAEILSVSTLLKKKPFIPCFEEGLILKMSALIYHISG